MSPTFQHRAGNVRVRELSNGRVVAEKKTRVVPVPDADPEALEGKRGYIAGIYCFEVPGEPLGKGRPRFGRSPDGRPVTYTDPQTVAYEQLVAMMARNRLPPRIEGPVAVTIHMKLPRTKGRVQPPSTAGVDCDNHAKAILDGLKSHFDDRQVVRLEVSKERAPEGEEPRSLVRVEG